MYEGPGTGRNLCGRSRGKGGAGGGCMTEAEAAMGSSVAEHITRFGLMYCCLSMPVSCRPIVLFCYSCVNGI